MIIHLNSHIVYMKLLDDISLLNFKIFLAKGLVSRYSHPRLFPTIKLSKQNSHETIHDQSNPNLYAWVPVDTNEISWFQEWKLRLQIFSVLSVMCPVLMPGEREKFFFEASFVVFHHDFFLILYLLDYSCVDCSGSCCVFCVVEYAYIF